MSTATVVGGPSGTKKVTNDSSWASWSKDPNIGVNVAGLGLDGPPTMTGERAYEAIVKLAYTNPQQWGKIRAQLVAMRAYTGKKMPVFTSNWTSADENAVKDALTNYHLTTLPAPSTHPTTTAATPPSPFLKFAQDTAHSVKTNGYAPYTTGAATALISVPATADLNQIAQDEFAKKLGRGATPQEQADFAQKFQNLVLSYGQAKHDKKTQTAFTAPDGSISTSPPAGIEAPPSADIAAGNFALKADPAGAAANGLDDAMNSWFASLEHGVGK